MTEEQYERLWTIFDSLIIPHGSPLVKGRLFDEEKWLEALKAENVTSDDWIKYLCDKLDKKFKLGEL